MPHPFHLRQLGRYPRCSAASLEAKQTLFSGLILLATAQVGKWYLLLFLLPTKRHFTSLLLLATTSSPGGDVIVSEIGGSITSLTVVVSGAAGKESSTGICVIIFPWSSPASKHNTPTKTMPRSMSSRSLYSPNHRSIRSFIELTKPPAVIYSNSVYRSFPNL